MIAFFVDAYLLEHGFKEMFEIILLQHLFVGIVFICCCVGGYLIAYLVDGVVEKAVHAFKII